MLYASNWELWQLYHKVTFDGINRKIIVNPGENTISIKADVYSAWKEWVMIERNSMFEPALRTIGGDQVGSGEFAGDMYFLMNGWQIIVDHFVKVDGVIYHDDPIDTFIILAGGGVSSKVSNLVQTVEVKVIDNELIADAVWTRTQRELTSSSVSSLTLEQNNKLMSLNNVDVPSAVSISEAVWSNISRTLTQSVAAEVDLSTIPAAVWSYVSRELTVTAGLTTFQEGKIDNIISKLSTTLDANIKSVQGIAVTNVNDFKADVSNIPDNVDYSLVASSVWSYVSRELTVAAGLTPAQETTLNSILTKLGTTLDSNIKSVQGVAVTNVNDFKADVSGISVNIDPSDIWSHPTRELTVASGLTPTQEAKIDAIKGKTDKLTFDLTNHLLSYIEDKAGFSLTSNERILIANEVESQIINDTDSEKVLQAITDKIASVNPSLGSLTTGTIASAVWSFIIGGSSSSAYLSNINNKVNALPTLANITSSSLAKEVSVQATLAATSGVQTTVNGLPTLLNITSSSLAKSSEVSNVLNGVNLANINIDALPTLNEITASSLAKTSDVNAVGLDVKTLLVDVSALPSIPEINQLGFAKELTSQSILGNINSTKSLVDGLPTLLEMENSELAKEISVSTVNIKANALKTDIDSLLTSTGAVSSRVNTLPTIIDIEASNLVKTSDLDAISGVVNSTAIKVNNLPTLVNIESSNVLAKNSSVSQIRDDISTVNTNIDQFESNINLNLINLAKESSLASINTVLNSTKTRVDSLPTLVDILNPVNGLASSSDLDILNLELDSIGNNISALPTLIVNSTANLVTTTDFNSVKVDITSTKTRVNSLPTLANIEGSNLAKEVTSQTILNNTQNIKTKVDSLPTIGTLTSAGLATSSEIQLMDSKVQTINSKIDNLPTLPEIEASSLAKEVSVQAVDLNVSQTKNAVNSTDIKIQSIDARTQTIKTSIDSLPDVSEITFGIAKESSIDNLTQVANLTKTRVDSLPTLLNITASSLAKSSDISSVDSKVQEVISKADALIVNDSNQNILINSAIQGISLADAKIESIPLLSEIEASSVLAKQSGFNGINSKVDTVITQVNTKPTLAEIEASSVLAKTHQLNAVEAVLNNLPSMTQIRNELINVQFGKLEIVNNQMKVWDKAGVLIVTYNLFDKNGLPTMSTVYRREVV